MRFQAIGTSSTAIAALQRYKDGEKMSFTESCSAVKTRTIASQLPITVDTESGFSRNPNKIVGNIKILAKFGVTGINIEDSVVNGEQVLVDTDAPLNVMCMPNLSGSATLKDLDIKRISMGNFLFNNMYSHFEYTLKTVAKTQDFSSLF